MVTVQCAAVPSMVSELVLALSDPLFGSLPNCLHDVRVALAKLPLLVHQAGDVVTDYTGTECADIPTINKQTHLELFQTESTIPWPCVLKNQQARAIDYIL